MVLSVRDATTTFWNEQAKFSLLSSSPFWSKLCTKLITALLRPLKLKLKLSLHRGTGSL